MIKSKFHIAKMDCPSEENLIRMKLDGVQTIKKLEFDIENRNLTVFHLKEDNDIFSRLESLNFGAKLIETTSVDEDIIIEDSAVQSKLLWIVLIINFSFFIIEMTTGLLSKSMGLIADSLDMLADSLVYILSLLAVGATIIRKKRVARISGYFQISLAIIGIIEVFRRVFSATGNPDYRFMIGVSILALLANWACLYILQKSKSKEAHMKASMIFTSNDIIINAGVVIAGVIVLLTNSKYPDLIVGVFVFGIVLRGAYKIIGLGK
jgi:Co/Zn/Cd efflux system component